MKILIVDDDPRQLETMAAYCELRGVQVDTERDGDLAYVLVKDYDLIVSDYDLGLGKPDGIKILMHAAYMSDRPRELILMSGLERREAKELGLTFYNKMDLPELLDHILELHAQSS